MNARNQTKLDTTSELITLMPAIARASRTENREHPLRAVFALLLIFCLAVLVGGCAKTKVTDRQQHVFDRLARPNHIWVYQFAASPAEVPAYSPLAGQVTAGYQTPEEIAVGHQLGAMIASELVQRIREMGLPAEVATAATQHQVNDIVIQGYLISVDQGSGAKRMTIGFGSGTSELQTGVEGYEMTAQGLRKLGSAVLESEGSKTPGAALGGAGWIITGSPAGLIVGGGMKAYGELSGSAKVEGRAKATAKKIAKELEKRFKDQGWL